MRVEYINPFVEAAIHVLQEMTGEEFERGELALKNIPIITQGVVIVIGITGQIEGRVLYDMNKQTAMNIASFMMGGEEITAVDELTKSALNELGNIISGNAISMLNDMGFKFDITPPTLFSGDGMEITSPNMETLIIPLISDKIGEVIVNVALREREG
jgi:chemotaxis protein CheX